MIPPMLATAPTWAALMARDFTQANIGITLSALSFLPPRSVDKSPFSAWYAALVAAQMRGVMVHIILPAPTRAHPATLRNGAFAQQLHATGLPVTLIKPGNLLHAKTALIDGRIVWCGSGNFTAAAAHHNHEAYIRSEDVTIAAAIVSFYKKVLSSNG